MRFYVIQMDRPNSMERTIDWTEYDWMHPKAIVLHKEII